MNTDTRLYLNEEYFLDNAMRDEYLMLGAVGLIYGRFIDSEGREIDGPLRERTMAIELDTARAAPARLAICGGREKTAAVAATLRAGFATHLVTDEKTAKRLLREIS
jgi:dihydroxyacetone kinase-like protein